MSEQGPPAPERIRSLDVLRGLALLGILAVNAPFFAQPWPLSVQPSLGPPTGVDAWVWAAVHVLADNKFITLFSMLFGVSLYLVGGEGGLVGRGGLLRRRLAWLLLFGLIHGALIWYGDILLAYALSGLLIVQFCRGMSARTLLAAGIAAHLIFSATGLLSVAGPGREIMVAMFRQALEQANGVDGGYRGGFADSMAANMRDWMSLQTLVLVRAVLTVSPLMLIGLGLFKAGVLSGQAPRAVYTGLVAAGALALGLLAWLAADVLGSGFAAQPVLLLAALNGMIAPLVTLLYASLLILAVRSPIANALAPVGRMAFTNYLLQSILMTAVFYGGRGLGLYGTLGLAEQLGIVVVIWIAQLIWSPLWLSRFAYGPFEWVWRTLTLGRPAPIRRSPGAAA